MVNEQIVNMKAMYTTPHTEQTELLPTHRILGASQGDISISETAADPSQSVW